jgi:hypothetical protein
MAKIHWKAIKNATEPGDPTVPGTLDDVDFMMKDSKRFADSGGWGYAVFEYDAATDTFRPGNLTDTSPQAQDAKCGFACHTLVTANNYVFTAYSYEQVAGWKRITDAVQVKGGRMFVQFWRSRPRSSSGFRWLSRSIRRIFRTRQRLGSFG